MCQKTHGVCPIASGQGMPHPVSLLMLCSCYSSAWASRILCVRRSFPHVNHMAKGTPVVPEGP